ncbi:hypothetical protein T4A_1437 [Trichinella pseudospiralis]|uniref:Uncharacterized protein n=1 Tax=Trichinella pseudospiralis TaxID=6337 RepID=A0A0V1E8B2_TRIPS|nr:hypothetical protein T4A_1437 [Trichinella pseudospiralis]
MMLNVDNELQHVEGTLLANLGMFGNSPSKKLTLPKSNVNDPLMNKLQNNQCKCTDLLDLQLSDNFATIGLELHPAPLEAHGCPMFLQACSTVKNDMRIYDMG